MVHGADLASYWRIERSVNAPAGERRAPSIHALVARGAPRARPDSANRRHRSSRWRIVVAWRTENATHPAAVRRAWRILVVIRTGSGSRTRFDDGWRIVVAETASPQAEAAI